MSYRYLRGFLWLALASVITLAKDASASQKRKATLLSIDTHCDGDYVRDLDSVSGNTSHLFGFNVTKLTPNFRIDIRIEAIDGEANRVYYKLENLDGCWYLGNRQIKSLFTRFYNEMIVNNTHFKCPIQPGIYYIKNYVSANVIPEFHPYGSYQLITRLRVPNWKSVLLELVWKYRIQHA